MFSQALTALTASFQLSCLAHSGMLSRGAGADSGFWQQLLHCGYLALFESLLSTKGHEEGMLQDYDGGVNMLQNVRFRLVSDSPGPDGVAVQLVAPGCMPASGAAAQAAAMPTALDLNPRLMDEAQDVLVDVHLGPHFPFHKLPSELQDGHPISVVPVLVTQVSPSCRRLWHPAKYHY